MGVESQRSAGEGKTRSAKDKGRSTTIKKKVYQEIKECGQRLARKGYVAAYGGNISIRKGKVLFITRHGSSLENLGPEDIVEVSISKPTGLDKIASTDTKIHKAIYNETEHLAVLHAHPPYSVVLSFFNDEITPLDVEGNYLLKLIPVVEGKVGSRRLAGKISRILKDYPSVLVRGHGVFTGGKDLDSAYQIVTMVEHSSRIVYLVEHLRRWKLRFKLPKMP